MDKPKPMSEERFVQLDVEAQKARKHNQIAYEQGLQLHLFGPRDVEELLTEVRRLRAELAGLAKEAHALTHADPAHEQGEYGELVERIAAKHEEES